MPKKRKKESFDEWQDIYFVLRKLKLYRETLKGKVNDGNRTILTTIIKALESKED